MAVQHQPALRELLDTWDRAERAASRIPYGSPEWEEANITAGDARWTYIESREQHKADASAASRGVLLALEEIESIEGLRRVETPGGLPHRALSARLRAAALELLRLATEERDSSAAIPTGSETIGRWELAHGTASDGPPSTD
jgi:hypothetical protein